MNQKGERMTILRKNLECLHKVDVCRIIRDYRKEKKMSYLQFGMWIGDGVSHSQIWKWEVKGETPSWQSLMKIGKAHPELLDKIMLEVGYVPC
jgi:DNA-binding transcriptional regulator YiaG